MNFLILGGFQKKMNIFGVLRFCGYFLGVISKFDYIWGNFYAFYGLFLRSGYIMGVFLGVGKISNIFLGCLKFLMF